MLVTIDIPAESLNAFRALCAAQGIESSIIKKADRREAIRVSISRFTTRTLLLPWASFTGLRCRMRVTLVASSSIPQDSLELYVVRAFRTVGLAI